MEEFGEISLMPRYLIIEWGAQEKPEDTDIVFLRFSFSELGQSGRSWFGAKCPDLPGTSQCESILVGLLNKRYNLFQTPGPISKHHTNGFSIGRTRYVRGACCGLWSLTRNWALH